MADTTTVVEGKVKYRDGRKWKQRWCVLKKPSPVADRLQVLLYKDVKDAIKDGSKPKSCFPIESFFGLQSGFSYDKENNALAIICQKQVTLFSFENREDLINFEIKIRKSLGEERQFSVQVAKMPSHSKLPHDFIQMLIHGQKFCLISQVPPKILQSWHISDLRRFGTVDGKFLFEGGSRCNKGSGLHAVISDQVTEIDEIINLASVGKTTSCHRNTNKRGSQFSEAFDSFNTFSNFFNNNQMVDRPSMLSCCNENNNLQEVDEMGFHKRHSISVMDYRRMASLTEKFKLMSMENLERQRMLAMYDIPPKYAREVRKQKTAQTGSPKKTNTNRYSVSCSELKGGNSELSRMLSDSLSQSFNTHIYTNTPLLKPELPVGPPASPNHQDPSSNSHYSHNYQKNKLLTINPLCIIEDEARTAFDRSKRQEAMQRLQKQENDLHKEITLLDEILQVCKTDEPPGATSKNSTISLSEKASSLPNKVKKELRGENFMSSQTSISSSSESCAKSSLSHSDLHYPKPVKRTKISAPLPYVNLSQFDVGDDNGRVHLSKEGLVKGSSSGSINKSPDKNHSTPIKKSSESLCSSSSSGSHTALYPTEAWMREPIYANEPNRCETPPPELPPKGPALLRKNRLSRNSTSFSQSSKTPPPLPPSRNRSRSLGSQSKFQVNDSSQTFNSFDQVVPPAPKSGVEDTYLMMGGFPDQPKEKKKSMVFDSPEVKQLSKGNADVMNCYMDMAAFFKNDAESRKGKTIPQVKVEEAIYDTIDDTVDSQTEPIPKAPIRESNYMVMEVSKCRRKSSTSIEDQHSASPITNKSSSPLCIKRNSVIQRLQTLQNYVSTTKAGEINSGNGSVVIPKPTMPFQNLLEFKPQHLHSAGVYINSIQNTINPEETSPEPTSKKEEGFLARFKRRNSKDQSKASLSNENLATKTSRTSLFEKSLSEEGEVVENSSSPLKIIRQRSSSFPNRRSCQEDETDTIEMVNDSLKSDSTNDDVFSHSDDPHSDETFFSSSSIKLKTGSKNNIDDIEEPKKEMHVLTVLHLQHDPPVQNFYNQYTSSKTDDEKMIELLHTDDKLHNKKSNYSFMSELKSKLSLPLSKAGSELPTEGQLPALPPPPVLPPKFRMYPTLSPVVETTPSTPLPPAEPIYVEMTEPAIKPQSMSETVQQSAAQNRNETNQQDEDYCQNINIDYREPFSGGAIAYERALQSLQKKNRIIVQVEDFKERLARDDSASISSNEYPETCSLQSNTSDNPDCSCSPAKTVLRPRSGKEYIVVERIRKLSDSYSSAPSSPLTPTSPASVFTFDIHEPSSNVTEGTGTIRSAISPLSKSSKSDNDSAPTSPWIPIPKKCLRNQSTSSEHRSRTRNDSVSNSDSATKESHYVPIQKSASSASHKNRRSGSSARSSKRRSQSTRSKHDLEKSHLKLEYLSQPDSDSDSVNLALHGRCDSVSYRKNGTSGASLRLMGSEAGAKGDSVYLQLWDTKATKSNSPKASVSSETSPPISPNNALLLPLTPIDDDDEQELNYLEMDLGPATSSSLMPKKSVPKKPSNDIEYTAIDMMATKALKDAGKEHAQGRTDSLRRTRSMKYPPLSHHSSLRERKGSTSSARERKLSASTVEFKA